jgi:glycine cleavage system H protein
VTTTPFTIVVRVVTGAPGFVAAGFAFAFTFVPSAGVFADVSPSVTFDDPPATVVALPPTATWEPPPPEQAAATSATPPTTTIHAVRLVRTDGAYAQSRRLYTLPPMNIPDDLRYSKEHEWVRLTGETARIGITDFAQENLGDIVFVQLPDLGLDAVSGASVSEIESTKSVSEIYAPVSGEITAVNQVLAEQPELVNSDPYGEGWMFEVRCSDPSEAAGLLDAAGYRAFIEG